MIRSGRAGEDINQQLHEAAEKDEGRHGQRFLNAKFENASALTYTGTMEPCTPTSSRSISFARSLDFERSYRRIMSGVITANNIRRELRLEERYEKPHLKKQRLASARHRRRFARAVGLKVAAVMKAKSQGM